MSATRLSIASTSFFALLVGMVSLFGNNPAACNSAYQAVLNECELQHGQCIFESDVDNPDLRPGLEAFCERQLNSCRHSAFLSHIACLNGDGPHGL